MLLPSLLVLLFPLAMYCWVLGVINRRPRPTVVSGVWDSIGMLLALGGLLLVVVPFLINRVFQRVMASIPVDIDAAAPLQEAHRQEWLAWAAYFTLLPLALFGLVWSRRHKTVIYNLDIELFASVFQDALGRLGLHARRDGKYLAIEPILSPVLEEGIQLASAVVEPVRSPRANPTDTLVEVEVFPAMCNVTLHWLRDDGKRRAAVEQQLRRDIEGARTFDNPASSWLMGLTGLLFGLVCLTGMVWFLVSYFPPRH